MMHRKVIFLGLVLFSMIVDFNYALKRHRDRGGHRDRDEQESMLDKLERDRDKKDRKNDDDKKGGSKNITCYKCDGELCRDPFPGGDSVAVVECEHSCWKGVFASSVRRSCGNKRCGFAFQGGSAISNTCCERDSPNEFKSTDELSEVMSKITKTVHLNTPEQTLCELDISSHSESKLSNNEDLIERLNIQLTRNKLGRTQPRDYLRILGQSKTPASWYKTPSTSRSVYFYDPNFQKNFEQTVNYTRKLQPSAGFVSSQRIRAPGRSSVHSNVVLQNTFALTPRTKYMSDVYDTTRYYHQQRQHTGPSHETKSSHGSYKYVTSLKSQSIQALPSIRIAKEQHNEPLNPLVQSQHDNKSLKVNVNEKQVSTQLETIETRKKPHLIVMPPIL